MNVNKPLKPNLLNLEFEKKVIRTLSSNQVDYWAPVKKESKNFYQNYIRKNIYLVILIVIIIILLIYRYFTTKKKRETNKIEQILEKEPYVNQYIDPSPYTDLLLELYNQDKEKAIEPKIKGSRLKSVSNPKFAYPMYPYTKGGTLSPSKR